MGGETGFGTGGKIILVCVGPAEAEGGGVSSHDKSDSCGGGAENGLAPFVRIDGGIRVCGRDTGISFPASLP